MEVAVGAFSALAGIDMSKNHSYYAIPAAWACAHLPHLYAAIGSRAFDNNNPRAFRDGIAKSSKLSAEQRHYYTLVKSASDNGYETLGLFAAAVVAANQAGLSNQTLNLASWGYIVTRLVYNTVYINQAGALKALAPFRPLIWTIGIVFSLGMFVAAGRQINA